MITPPLENDGVLAVYPENQAIASLLAWKPVAITAA
jgi:hypothetical protein